MVYLDRKEQMKVAEAMTSYGGSFVVKLGYALMSADQNNARKIKETWLEYWEKYKKIGIRDTT